MATKGRPGAISSERPFEVGPLLNLDRCTGPTPSHRVRLDTFRNTDRTRTSRFRGVHKADKGRWTSVICDQRLAHPHRAKLGTYGCQQTTAYAYDIALILLGHEPQNFPLEHYRTAFPRDELERSFRAIAARLRLRS